MIVEDVEGIRRVLAETRRVAVLGIKNEDPSAQRSIQIARLGPLTIWSS